MHPNRHALPVRLLTRDPLDMHYIFESVDGGDGPFTAFVRAANDGHFVVFADGDGADLGWEERRQLSEGMGKGLVVIEFYRAYFVLVPELFVQRGGHDDSADAGWGAEVRFARLSP